MLLHTSICAERHVTDFQAALIAVSCYLWQAILGYDACRPVDSGFAQVELDAHGFRPLGETHDDLM